MSASVAPEQARTQTPTQGLDLNDPHTRKALAEVQIENLKAGGGSKSRNAVRRGFDNFRALLEAKRAGMLADAEIKTNEKVREREIQRADEALDAQALLKAKREILPAKNSATMARGILTREEFLTLADSYLADPKASVDSIDAAIGQMETRKATERQRGISNEFREQAVIESKRRYEERKATWTKKEGGIDGKKVGDWADRELGIFQTRPEALGAMLSDDEVRAALNEKSLGPAAREVLEGFARSRNVSLLPADAATAPSLGAAPGAREVDPDVARVEAEERRLGRPMTDEEIAAFLARGA